MTKGKKKWLTLAAVVVMAVAPVLAPAPIAAALVAAAGALMGVPVALPPVDPAEGRK